MNQLLKITMLLMAVSCSGAVIAADYGDKAVTIIRVHDGDSITVSVPDWPGIIGDKMPVRVYGIDTPEINGLCPIEKKNALLAKEFTKAFLPGKQVMLKNIRRDKYFRLLADVYVDDKNLSAALIASGLAKPYFGGKKTDWCPAQ